MVTRAKDQIWKIIVHCSDSPDGVFKARYNNRYISYDAKEIDFWHHRNPKITKRTITTSMARPDLEWIGYHAIILPSGIAELGRSEIEIGCHCSGENAHSLGVCLIGRSKFTEAQWRSLRSLVTQWAKKYSISAIHGHNEFSIKKCPGFNVQEWVKKDMLPVKEHIYSIKRS